MVSSPSPPPPQIEVVHSEAYKLDLYARLCYNTTSKFCVGLKREAGMVVGRGGDGSGERSGIEVGRGWGRGAQHSGSVPEQNGIS